MSAPIPVNLPHSIAVFLGPSLGLKQARELLTTDYFPPARRGDIYRIMASGVKTIVLVDGLFHNTPSVWPREILYALEEGIQVIGAASMGALRAAELHPFGMQGHGTVFEWYRDGVVEGDDEVAVNHASAEFGFRPLSEALVNIRCTLNRAVAEGVLAGDQALQLLGYARDSFYPERSYQKPLSSPVVSRWSERDQAAIHDYLLHKAANLKAEDTIGVLRHAARLPGAPVATVSDGGQSLQDLWQLERLRLTGFAYGSDIVTGEAVLEEARKDPGLLASMRTTLSKRCFLLDWARQNGIDCPEEVVDAFIARWERRHNISDYGAWRRANGLTPHASRTLLAQHALAEWLTRKGPAHFGVEWDIEEALHQERNARGRTTETGPGEPDCSSIPSEALLDEDLEGTATRTWVELTHRRFLLEWAKHNGISCPAVLVQAYREEWERAHPVEDRSSWAGSVFLNLATYHNWLDERATADWIMSQGPNHFGFWWSFEEELLKELQITGRAAQLVEHHQRS